MLSSFFPGELAAPSVLVVTGASFQAATGVGLGLIAAPGLLLLMAPDGALQLAIALNLLLSLILLPFERKDVLRGETLKLSAWALLGIPLGLIFVVNVGGAWLKIIGGVLVLLSSVQLIMSHEVTSARLGRWFGMRGCGAMSGVMTGALSMPGPIALWAMLNTGKSPTQIRATLRAYFAIAYGAALVLHVAANGYDPAVMAMFLRLVPFVLLGIGLGQIGKRLLPEPTLRQVLVLLLVAMGLVLAMSGVRDAIDI